MNNNCVPIARLDQSSKITSDTKPSEGPNIPLAPAAPTPLDPRLGTPALSPPALASLKLSPVLVKQEEIPISLQTLRQSQSLKRVRVKKESRSPSLHFTVGPHRRTRSPPRLQSLSYVTPPPGFLQRLNRRRRREAARAQIPLEVRPADSHNHRLRPRAVLRPPRCR